MELEHCILKTPNDYYEWTLEKRATHLGASSTTQLCKSVIMENTRLKEDSEFRYILVIIQYIATIHKESLIKAIQAVDGKNLGKKQYNFRFAPEAICDQLSGFKHNAVCPIGMASSIPIMVDSALVGQDVIYLGAGDVDKKLKCRPKQLVDKLKCHVGDVSRVEAEPKK